MGWTLAPLFIYNGNVIAWRIKAALKSGLRNRCRVFIRINIKRNKEQAPVSNAGGAKPFVPKVSILLIN